MFANPSRDGVPAPVEHFADVAEANDEHDCVARYVAPVTHSIPICLFSAKVARYAAKRFSGLRVSAEAPWRGAESPADPPRGAARLRRVTDIHPDPQLVNGNRKAA